MSININDTTPAAPSGSTNVKWQIDGSNNVSAYVPGASNFYGFPSSTAGAVRLATATTAHETADSSEGGMIFGGSVASGDHVLAYGVPVTPSSTLKVRLGFQGDSQAQVGPVIWNANTGNIVFVRLIPGTSWHGSEYAVTTGFVSDTAFGTKNFPPPFPASNATNQFFAGWLGVYFDSSNWYIARFLDPQLKYISSGAVDFTSTLSGYIGTNYTHVGVGINLAGSSSTTFSKSWLQDLVVVTP